MLSQFRMAATRRTLVLASLLLLSPAAAFSEEQIGRARTYREAYDLGYGDGRQAGLQDRQQGTLFDLANHAEFQSADRGYEDGRHEREVFLVAYRRGFEDGYEEGYGLSPAPAGSRVSEPPAPARDERPRTSASKRLAREAVVPAGTEIEVELLDVLSTRFNEKGDTFRTRVFRDIQTRQGVVIPEGTQLYGRIAHIKRAGRVRGRAQMSLLFEELRFLDGRSVGIEGTLVGVDQRSSETVRDEEGTIEAGATRGEDLGRIGKTSALGALIGVMAGGKGAGVGALGGAAVGLGSVLLTRGKDAQLETRTRLRIRLTEDLKVE